MASFFVSPPFISHSITRSNISSSSQSPTPQPPNVPPQPQIPPPTQQQLSVNSAESPPSQEQRPNRAPTRTNAKSTDWIASRLTRRFGIGAGLAWAGFLAVGVVSKQIKTWLEVSQ